MRPSFFLSSLSLLINIVPHKLKVLHGNIVNVIETILGGGLGLHLVNKYLLWLRFFPIFFSSHQPFSFQTGTVVGLVLVGSINKAESMEIAHSPGLEPESDPILYSLYYIFKCSYELLYLTFDYSSYLKFFIISSFLLDDKIWIILYTWLIFFNFLYFLNKMDGQTLSRETNSYT